MGIDETGILSELTHVMVSWPSSSRVSGLSETSIEYVTGDSGIPPEFMPLALPTAYVVRDARMASERKHAFNRLLVIMVLVAWLAKAKCKQIRPGEGVVDITYRENGSI